MSGNGGDERMLTSATHEIIKKADSIVRMCETRNPRQVAKELGIIVFDRSFSKQKGAYTVVMKNRYVFLKEDLHPVMADIVLWHEIGHDQFHRDKAVKNGAFKEFNIFDMQQNRMEYEANIFAAQASLDDDDVLECIEYGYDIQQTARALRSDINLVILKVDTLIQQGYRLRRMEHRNDFLKG